MFILLISISGFYYRVFLVYCWLIFLVDCIFCYKYWCGVKLYYCNLNDLGVFEYVMD